MNQNYPTAPPRPRRPRQPHAQQPVQHHAAKMYDPFAPVSEQQMEQRANVYGPVQSEQQIQRTAGRQARAQVSPLLQQITGDISARSNAEQANLAGATRNYQDQAARYTPAVADAYQHAEQQQQQLNQALSAALTQNGGSYGQGMANADLAGGSAELSRLLANETSARQYGAQLPGIAANTGSQRASQVAGQYADELRSETSDLNSKIPGLIAGLLGDLHSTNDTRRANRATALNSERDRATNAAVFRKEYGLKAYGATTDRKRAAASAAHNRASDSTRRRALDVSAAALGVRASHDAATERNANRRADISAQNAATSNRRAGISAKNAATSEARLKQQGHQVDAEASRNRGILIGKDGRPILKYKVKNGRRVKGTGRTVPYKPKKSGSGSSAGTQPPAGSPKAKQ